ncbi:MAG TPA: TonB-dependent receptor, partial [Albitalea sp.]|nr:TonB-dependent receptor [Albitalea sp.]
MLHSLRTCALVALAILLFSTFAVAAQNAILYGTVFDVANKPLPGVAVKLENPSLGLSRIVFTNADGVYTFAEVQPAEGYRVIASRQGVQIDMRDGIVVNVGDERIMVPPLHERAATAPPSAPQPIQRGLVTERVSASNSGVITGEQLRSLPLYNRNFLALGLLTPNTHDVEGGSALTGATFSIAGARATSNAFLMDGMDNVGSSSNQAIPFQVNDSIQEFRVISSLASAEFGRNLGGVVNVVTRRAASGFHGNLFGYFGNDALNADRPLSVYRGTGFDSAAAHAGSLTQHNISLAPITYNDYVAWAASNGYCTDSLSPAAGAGLHACP